MYLPDHTPSREVIMGHLYKMISILFLLLLGNKHNIKKNSVRNYLDKITSVFNMWSLKQDDKINPNLSLNRFLDRQHFCIRGKTVFGSEMYIVSKIRVILKPKHWVSWKPKQISWIPPGAPPKILSFLREIIFGRFSFVMNSLVIINGKFRGEN